MISFSLEKMREKEKGREKLKQLLNNTPLSIHQSNLLINKSQKKI